MLIHRIERVRGKVINFAFAVGVHGDCRVAVGECRDRHHRIVDQLDTLTGHQCRESEAVGQVEMLAGLDCHNSFVLARLDSANPGKRLPRRAELFAVDVPGERLGVRHDEHAAVAGVRLELVEELRVFVRRPWNDGCLVVAQVTRFPNDLAVADEVEPVLQARPQRCVGREMPVVVARQSAPLVGDRSDRGKEDCGVRGFRHLRQFHLTNDLRQFEHRVPFERLGIHPVRQLRLEKCTVHQVQAFSAIAEDLAEALPDILRIAHRHLAFCHVHHHPDRFAGQVDVELGRAAGTDPVEEGIGLASDDLAAVNIKSGGPRLDVSGRGRAAMGRAHNLHVRIDLFRCLIPLDERFRQPVPGPTGVGDAIERVTVRV